MLSVNLDIILSFVSAITITAIAIPKVIFFAEKLRLFAPKAERAAHVGDVPSLGGIAIFFGIIASLLFWSEQIANIQFILTSLLIVFFVGVIAGILNVIKSAKNMQK